MVIDVLIERGQRKVFASALDWPGWARAARTSDEALAALEAAAPRYRVVTERAGVHLPMRLTFEVVETVPGSATVDFGAPAASASADERRVSKAQAERLADLLEACWSVLDDVAAESPEELTNGPRGGGRDRTKMLAHVFDAEARYTRSIGLQSVGVSPDDRVGLDARRATIAEVFRSARSPYPESTRKVWPYRYAIRRFAWHGLDQAWGMADRRP